MKLKMTMMILCLSLLFAAVANAETYMVVKGDNLSKIGKKYNLTWQAIAQANADKIKDPNRIFPDQILTIPTPTVTVESQAQAVDKKAEFTPLNDLGRYPFGSKRDGIKAVKMFNLPEAVKQALIAKMEKGEFDWSVIRNGDRFSEMVFGNYKIAKNKVANWDSSHLEAARLYKVEFKGKIYLLFDPIKCRNWAWRSEKLPPEPEPEPEPKPKPEPKPEPRPAPAKKQLLMLLIPPPEQGGEGTITVVGRDDTEPYYENETFMWYGSYLGLSGNGKSAYVGGKHNSFFARQATQYGVFREGLGLTANAWKGDVDGFYYRGDRFSVGPVADWTNKSGTRVVGTVQIGKQRDFGRDGDGYSASQHTDMLYLGEATDFYNVGPFYKIEWWNDLNIDIGHSKTSDWRGSPIPRANDPAGNKDSIYSGARFFIWQGDGLKGGVVTKATYTWEDYGFGKSGGLFLADQGDLAKVDLEFRNLSGSKYETNNGNSIGFGAVLDLGKLWDKAAEYVESKKKSKEEVK